MCIYLTVRHGGDFWAKNIYDQDDVLPARVLEISEETAAIVKDADGPGFNIGD